MGHEVWNRLITSFHSSSLLFSVLGGSPTLSIAAGGVDSGRSALSPLDGVAIARGVVEGESAIDSGRSLPNGSFELMFGEQGSLCTEGGVPAFGVGVRIVRESGDGLESLNVGTGASGIDCSHSMLWAGLPLVAAGESVPRLLAHLL